MLIDKWIVVTAALMMAGAGQIAVAHGNYGLNGGGLGMGFSFYFGGPLFYPPVYAYYNYPPLLYLPYYLPIPQASTTPPVYIEPGSEANERNSDWAYCRSSDGYFPQVQRCPEGWQDLSSYPAGELPGYWYYCESPAGYYPHVRYCQLSWRRTNPEPP